MNATERRAWLTIGIPTVPRKTGADYLTLTLESLLEELPLDRSDPLYGRVRVLVMNNRPGNHTVFYKVRQWIPLLVFARSIQPGNSWRGGYEYQATRLRLVRF